MGDISIGGDMVIEASVDGDEVAEISIDDCIIGFGEPLRTGWFSITDGGGNYGLDLTTVNKVLEASIRFRGMTPKDYTKYTDYGSYAYSDWTDFGSEKGYPTAPSVPASAYGYTHTKLGHSVRVWAQSKYTGDEATGSNMCDDYDDKSVNQEPQWTPIIYPAYGYIYPSYCNETPWFRVGVYGWSGEVRGKGDANTKYRRRYNSADTWFYIEENASYYKEYVFLLNKNDLSPDPSEEGDPYVVECCDESGDLFWYIPLPEYIFVGGKVNTLQFGALYGSGDVEVELCLLVI